MGTDAELTQFVTSVINLWVPSAPTPSYLPTRSELTSIALGIVALTVPAGQISPPLGSSLAPSTPFPFKQETITCW